MPERSKSRDVPLGDQFQRGTKHRRGVRMPGADGKRPGARPLPAPEELIALPEPRRVGGPGLWGVVAARRSVRRYGGQPLTLEELSQLAWACQGITARTRGFAFRAAPSAGAQYPIDTYVLVGAVEGLAPGSYRYVPDAHALTLVRAGSVREDACVAAMDQAMVREAQLLLVWTATFARSRWRYGERCYRYAYLDAGHIAQNLALAAVGLGLASCQIAAYYDDEVDALVGVDGVHETVVYMSAVGRPVRERT
jgi:SagB-type dehydrogenase family enzyme